MTHYMNLHACPFAMIASERKTIELRLYDEKRRQIRVGDTIVFTCGEQSLAATVVALHRFPDFAALYRALPLDRCGYLPEELATASPADMDVYYSKEKQAIYGVLGIEIALLTEESQ